MKNSKAGAAVSIATVLLLGGHLLRRSPEPEQPPAPGASQDEIPGQTDKRGFHSGIPETLLVSTVSSGAIRKTEVEWCRDLAADLGCDRETGVEVTLATGTRVDLMNDRWAIECDWASKWAEGCGQALYYGICTGREPGLLLLLKSSDDRRYVDRAAVVAGKHGIGLWVYDTQRGKWLVMFRRGTE
jgi:hypothetical protein